VNDFQTVFMTTHTLQSPNNMCETAAYISLHKQKEENHIHTVRALK